MSRAWPTEYSFADVVGPALALNDDAIAATRAAVATKLSSLSKPTFDDHQWRHVWETAIDDVIVDRHGPWASGWRFAVGEGSIGGGVVRQWCCEQHSIVGSVDDIAGRAVGGLRDWRDWIVYLQRRFAQLAVRADDVDGRLRFGITQILAEVADATAAEDAWYNHAEQVLGWFLESLGMSSSRASRAVSHAVRGRFASWCTPTDDDTAAIVAAIARGVDVTQLKILPADDDLARHRVVRAQVDWKSAPAVAAHVGSDGHARFIDDVDAARDPPRAERLRAALRLTRQLATGGALVDLELVRSLHAIAVPDVDTRSGPAWAKQGHERYGMSDTLLADANDALGEADDVDVPVIARAARAYLDVCFFHVFVDGNARAARLVFDFILAREGVVLADVDAIFRHPIAAGDVDAATAFLSLCSTLALASSRRASSSKESAHGL